MTRIVADITMSLDGFITGPNAGPGNGLGDGGEPLHRWVFAGDPEFAELRGNFSKERDHGLRSIVVIDVRRIADSCGFAVPQLEFVGDRDVLDRSQERRPSEYYREYAVSRNATSIDGLPGLLP